MKKIFYIMMAAVALLMTGCKEDNWLDWKAQNEMWLENNVSHPYLYDSIPVQVTESGLQYQILSYGNKTDVRPQTNTTIRVSYTGQLINGYRFDSGNRTELSMLSVIAGFAEGMKKIYVHGDIVLYIPWDLGYGEEGSGTDGTSSYIPPYSTLIFVIHLDGVN